MRKEEIKVVGYKARYRDWKPSEKKPFGMHKFVALNGDRKAIELKGIMIGYTIFYKCGDKKFEVNYEV